MANGPLKICTSQPETLKPANSETLAVAASLLLPSISSSRETSVGRYDRYATSKKIVSTPAPSATA